MRSEGHAQEQPKIRETIKIVQAIDTLCNRDLIQLLSATTKECSCEKNADQWHYRAGWIVALQSFSSGKAMRYSAKEN